MNNKKVTIVIPVYKDWETLQKCIESLKKWLDVRHRVLIVNDNSSEADDLEKKIKDSVGERKNFFYERNEVNMGFVRTCNRAVLELDKTDNDILLLNSDTEVTEGFLEEMLEVLYAIDRHGVVCPRSNKATILSVPFLFDGDRDDIEQESYALWKKIKGNMPRFKKIPTGVGFCMLIRRDLIDNYGMFDEVFGMGYNEENDFCSRINQFGYSVVMANHAFVFHFESKSFTSEQKLKLQRNNNEILVKRFPEFPQAVEKYFATDVHPMDHFSDIIGEMYPKKRLLFSLYNLPSVFNGTSEQGLSLLYEFHKKFSDKYDIHVLTNRSGDKFHNLSKDFPTFYIDDRKVSLSRYDLAIVPSQIFDLAHLTLLNRAALKIVVVMQDIISWRSNYLSNELLEMTGRATMTYCNGFVTISEFTKNDILAYFSEQSVMPNNIFVAHLGTRPFTSARRFDSYDGQAIPRDYILILGNHFKHKSVTKALQSVQVCDHNFIVVGADENELHIAKKQNVIFFRSGFLSDEFLDSLYANCKLVLFPSQYEGFGLPIVRALTYQKRILVHNNAVNHELKNFLCSDRDQVTFFDRFVDIPHLIEKSIADNGVAQKQDVRTWSHYATDVESFITEILAKPLDADLLWRRWNFFNLMRTIDRDKTRTYGRTGGVKQIIQGMLFVIFHPVKFVRKYATKKDYLLFSWFFSIKTEGVVKSLMRVKNYLLHGKGFLK